MLAWALQQGLHHRDHLARIGQACGTSGRLAGAAPETAGPERGAARADVGGKTDAACGPGAVFNARGAGRRAPRGGGVVSPDAVRLLSGAAGSAADPPFIAASGSKPALAGHWSSAASRPSACGAPASRSRRCPAARGACSAARSGGRRSGIARPFVAQHLQVQQDLAQRQLAQLLRCPAEAARQQLRGARQWRFGRGLQAHRARRPGR